jgi:hypothetical protein
MFTHQVGWLEGKGVDIHPWGLRIKPHKLRTCIRIKTYIFN